MTTTLRPTGPEERSADGGRARSYDVCVNSRSVGSVRLAASQDRGPAVGRIVALHIDQAARRRGRATVAALAAEEVLRTWGCARVEVRVPTEGEGTLQLAHALGYVERDRHLVKLLEEAPVLPPGNAHRAMDEHESAAWLARSRTQLAGSTRETWQEQERTEWAAAGPSLPEGATMADTALHALSYQGREVGHLWMELPRSTPSRSACRVLRVEVTRGHRGRGHGRTLMLLAERECLAVGLRSLQAQVRADQIPAQRLCASLGYRVTTRDLYKRLL